MTQRMFLFFDLAGVTPGKPFDALAPGKFTDMWGRAVEIKTEELTDFLDNTKAAINRTKTEGGEVLGLPIDAQGHNEGDGAGWIVDVTLEKANLGDIEINVIRAMANWTKIGRELIGDSIRRMFSPTINLKSKTILGGTLTNWPATRDETGKVLLRPIELELEGTSTFESTADPEPSDLTEPNEPETHLSDTKVETEDFMPTNDELAQMVADQVKAQMASVQDEMRALFATFSKEDSETEEPPQTPPDILGMLELDNVPEEVVSAFKQTMLDQYEHMRHRAQLEAAQMIAGIRHENRVLEFTRTATGGNPEMPVGLPVPEEKLKEFAMTLNQNQFKQFTEIIDATLQSGLVDFREKGKAGDGKSLKKLPEDIATRLRSGDLDLADLSNTIITPIIGDPTQYDLSEWEN